MKKLVKHGLIVLAVTVALAGCGGQEATQDTAPDTLLADATAVTSVCQTNAYPDQQWWPNETSVTSQPQPATDGAPKIEQVRNGVVIATYTALGGDALPSPTRENVTDGSDTRVGPFRRASYRQWQSGDTFLVYPAVYRGRDMQIYVGPSSANWNEVKAGIYTVPENITIRGVTVDGKRPVIVNPPTTSAGTGGASYANYNNSLIYVEGKLTYNATTGQTTLIKPASNITIENIDVMDSPDGGSIGKAAVYISGVNNITLRNMRISGFKQHRANGIFGAGGNNSGTLKLENVELGDNGGNSGPEHNVYINSSAVDPNFTFHVVGSYSHGAYYGHQLKSRAQRTIVEGSYLAGRRADATMPQTEAYLLDIPNGGVAVVRNNVFAKNYSGDNSNGASLTFGVEGNPDGRPWSLTAEHNTFVAFSRYYDTQNHQLFPMYISSLNQGAWPKNVSSNVFVGYCPTGIAYKDYRGENYYSLDFSDVTN